MKIEWNSEQFYIPTGNIVEYTQKENWIKFYHLMFLRVEMDSEMSARLLIKRRINSFSSTCNAWLQDRSTKHSPDYRYLSDRLLSSSRGLWNSLF